MPSGAPGVMRHGRREEMHRSLEWRAFGIEEKLRVLNAGIGDKRANLPGPDTHTARKLAHWEAGIESILRAITGIKTVVRPVVEADLGYPIRREEMFILAFFQPSTRNLFAEIAVHFRSHDGCVLSEDDLTTLATLTDAAATLAWIGDAALKIGVLPEIWSPAVADAGVLTDLRRRYDSNENQAILCDRWRLYEHRIHLDPPVPAGNPVHLKGTLVESVYGIIFLQGGLRAVADATRLLRPPERA
jgi:hypothetical protein